MLIEKGYELDRDILPAIREMAPNKTFSSWRFFEAAIIERATRRAKIPERAAPPAEDWPGRLKLWRDTLAEEGRGYWPHAWGPKPGERDCRVPPELLIEERAA